MFSVLGWIRRLGILGLLFFSIHSFAQICLVDAVVDPDKIAAALSSGDWTAPILSPTHPLASQVIQVAEDLKEKRRISLSAFVTLVMRWEPFADADEHAGGLKLRTIPIEAAFPNFHRPDWRRANEGLTAAEWPRFLNSVWRLPKTDLFVHEITIPQSVISKNDSKWELLATLETLGELYPFLRRSEEGDHILTVPSFATIQSYLRFKYGLNAIELVPEVGVSEFETVLLQVRSGKRCLGLATRHTPIPKRIDGLRGNFTGFTWHDIFHALKGCQLDVTYRKILFRGLDVIEQAYQSLSEASPKIRVVEGLEIDPKLLVRCHTLNGTRAAFMDLLPTSGMEALNADLPVSARILSDFGPVEGGLSGLIVRDMLENTALYEGFGIDVPDTLRGMGSGAAKVIAKLSKQGN